MGCTQSKEKEQKELPPVHRVPVTQQKGSKVDDSEPVGVDVADSNDKEYEEALNSQYKMSGPSVEGESFACFKNGLLFRIVNDNTWAFYNDSQDYEMHIKVTFGPRSELTTLGNTKEAKDEADNFVLTAVVYPGVTEMFCEGVFDGYKSAMSAKPLSAAYRKRVAQEAEQRVKAEVDAVRHASSSQDAEERLRACINNKVPFVDLEFQPRETSLSRPDIDARKLPPTAWMRPAQYLPEKLHSHIRMFRKIDPEDIDQGALGDCWFLCAVAALAEFPQRVEKLFKHPVSAEAARRELAVGAMRVTLNKHGWWTNYVTDSYLPTVGGKPCFAKNIEDPAEMWVSILEKVYAKVHGSYSSIIGGDALQALSDLTGFPVNRFDTEWDDAMKSVEKSDELFEDLVRYDESHFLINLNTPGVDASAYMGGNRKDENPLKQKYADAGLGMGHAYSVLSVKHFPQQGFRMLKIRNPWGNSTEWTGRWGDHDDSWNQYPEIAKACNHGTADDGCFWMDWDSVKEYFDGGGVCFTRMDWFDYRVRGSFTGVAADVVLEVTVTKPTKMFCVLSQHDKRGVKSGEPLSSYQAMMLSIWKSAGDRMIVDLNSTSDADKPGKEFSFSFARDHALIYEFTPEEGPYLVVPRIHGPGQLDQHSYVLGLLSETPVGSSVKVAFKKLEPSCRIFSNYPKIKYDGAATALVETEFQHTPINGVPKNSRGTSLAF